MFVLNWTVHILFQGSCYITFHDLYHVHLQITLFRQNRSKLNKNKKQNKSNTFIYIHKFTSHHTTNFIKNRSMGKNLIYKAIFFVSYRYLFRNIGFNVLKGSKERMANSLLKMMGKIFKNQQEKKEKRNKTKKNETVKKKKQLLSFHLKMLVSWILFMWKSNELLLHQ